MLKLVAAILALAFAADAQVLRISPAVIGTSSAGQQQIINLGVGGSRSVLTTRPYSIAHPIAVTRPTAITRPIAPKLVALAQPAVVARPIAYTTHAIDESPKPYAFAFDSVDELGARHAREEQANGSGGVTGSYTVHDAATGITRLVKYIADENGFRAQVQTNEPGTITSAPAGAEIKSSAH